MARGRACPALSFRCPLGSGIGDRRRARAPVLYSEQLRVREYTLPRAGLLDLSRSGETRELLGVGVPGAPFAEAHLVVPHGEIVAGASVDVDVRAVGRVAALVDEEGEVRQHAMTAPSVLLRSWDPVSTRLVRLDLTGRGAVGAREAVPLLIGPNRDDGRVGDGLARLVVDDLTVVGSEQADAGHPGGAALKRGGPHHWGASRRANRQAEHDEAATPRETDMAARDGGATQVDGFLRGSITYGPRMASIAAWLAWQAPMAGRHVSAGAWP